MGLDYPKPKEDYTTAETISKLPPAGFTSYSPS
jgi:hypothetical protein